MKLRSKIVIGAAILLVIMILLMYLLPTYFVRKDIYEAASEIQTLLVQDHEKLLQSQKVWIENAIQKTEENINALLFMLAQKGNPFSSRLIFGLENSSVTVWETMAHVASLDPDIGMIQAHSPTEQESAVLAPFNSNLYKANRFQNRIALKDIKETFFAVPLPKEGQSDDKVTFYALVSSETSQDVIQFQKESEKVKEILKEKIAEFGSFSEASWAFKMSLIRILTPLYASLENPPLGIARLDHKGTGFAVLTREVFSKTPLFDDVNFFKSYPPLLPFPKIATGRALIIDTASKTAYQGNTLLLKTTYLTLAFPLAEFVRELALASNKTILLEANHAYWIGFNGEGQKLAEQAFKPSVETPQSQNAIYINGHEYVLTRVIELENGKLNFYEKHEGRGEKTIVATLFNLENKLTQRISLQLALIAFLSMLVILIFMGRIGLSVVYPVTKLAAATEKVAKGQYGEISLPDVGNRKDEVAVLTRSFQDMVKGLQEREKIRGVLDKVVSKDVADEILRTQIHLGGEDRIVSILFGDIRDFTRITSNLSPQETIHLLNECMTKISRVIEGEGGVIDKYVGDEVMAIFGAPTSTPDHALRAVSSGMLIIETLKKWNLDRVKDNKPAIEMGMGIHTGLVVAGNMGAEDRLNYTVLGSNVNLAARLCDIAKRDQLIISEKTLEEPNIKESFHVKPLQPITIKGFHEPIQSYEVIGFKWEEG